MRVRTTGNCSELEDRADFYWKRAAAVRALAVTLSAPEAREAMARVADDYERLAEALTRVVLLGEEIGSTSGRLPTQH
jgi:hypothetical protein